jgi:hypothetical protein
MAPAKQPREKMQRLAIFKERLLAAVPSTTLKDGRSLLEKILNAVEDEFSGVPFNLAAADYDGRMFPPLDDRRKVISANPRIEQFNSAGHVTWIGENGAIKIVFRRDRSILLDKPGRDGRTIDTL